MFFSVIVDAPCPAGVYVVPMVFFFNFLFCIGVYPVNNVVIILGEQRRNSAIHVHASILPQTPLPCRLPHNIEQSPVLYSRSLLVILFFFFTFLFNNFIYFWCAGPLSLLRLLSSCSEQASHCSGFSCCQAQALRGAGFSSCSSRARV